MPRDRHPSYARQPRGVTPATNHIPMPTPIPEPPQNPIRIGIIGGSGLGDTFAPPGSPQVKAVHHPDTPFGKPSGPITQVELGGTDAFLLQRHGPGHLLNPSAVPYRANIFALKALGVTHLLASGAVGSLREDLHPRDLVIVDQVIDKTYRRANTFYEKAAVHVELSSPFCPVMRKWLLEAAQRMDRPATVHDFGAYVCMEGPSFSTQAESIWHRKIGGDLIGMTCMPEARLAREAEIAYALIAMPTDYDGWRPRKQIGADPLNLLEEIIGNLREASAASLKLIEAALADLSVLQRQACPAHEALSLGIWSDKSMIDPEEVQRLAPLWGRHFQ